MNSIKHVAMFSNMTPTECVVGPATDAIAIHGNIGS